MALPDDIRITDRLIIITAIIIMEPASVEDYFPRMSERIIKRRPLRYTIPHNEKLPLNTIHTMRGADFGTGQVTCVFPVLPLLTHADCNVFIPYPLAAPTIQTSEQWDFVHDPDANTEYERYVCRNTNPQRPKFTFYSCKLQEGLFPGGEQLTEAMSRLQRDVYPHSTRLEMACGLRSNPYATDEDVLNHVMVRIRRVTQFSDAIYEDAVYDYTLRQFYIQGVRGESPETDEPPSWWMLLWSQLWQPDLNEARIVRARAAHQGLVLPPLRAPALTRENYWRKIIAMPPNLARGEQCSICFEKLEDPVSLTCNAQHTFCARCLQPWLDMQQTCPLDREDLRPRNPDGRRPLTDLNFIDDTLTLAELYEWIGVPCTTWGKQQCKNATVAYFTAAPCIGILGQLQISNELWDAVQTPPDGGDSRMVGRRSTWDLRFSTKYRQILLASLQLRKLCEAGSTAVMYNASLPFNASHTPRLLSLILETCDKATWWKDVVNFRQYRRYYWDDQQGHFDLRGDPTEVLGDNLDRAMPGWEAVSRIGIVREIERRLKMDSAELAWTVVRDFTSVARDNGAIHPERKVIREARTMHVLGGSSEGDIRRAFTALFKDANYGRVRSLLDVAIVDAYEWVSTVSSLVEPLFSVAVRDRERNLEQVYECVWMALELGVADGTPRGKLLEALDEHWQPLNRYIGNVSDDAMDPIVIRPGRAFRKRRLQELWRVEGDFMLQPEMWITPRWERREDFARQLHAETRHAIDYDDGMVSVSRAGRRLADFIAGRDIEQYAELTDSNKSRLDKRPNSDKKIWRGDPLGETGLEGPDRDGANHIGLTNILGHVDDNQYDPSDTYDEMWDEDIQTMQEEQGRYRMTTDEHPDLPHNVPPCLVGDALKILYAEWVKKFNELRAANIARQQAEQQQQQGSGEETSQEGGASG